MATNSKSKPSNWPQDVAFLTAPQYSPGITKNPKLISKYRPSVSSPTPPSSIVKIKPITDPSHPAFGQSGLFAAKRLPPRTHVIDYIGYVHTQAESDPTSDYDISLDAADGIAVDAARCGNEARFINDYRGVKVPGGSALVTRPNVEFGNRMDEKTGETRIAVYVGKWEIPKGQELLVSYGKGFWKARLGDTTLDETSETS
ncbi:hypothetical protein HK102_002184 [Quaeritorhiza haematococci]|nr:hypothetical protein HK102_002184 [Quaeritorhiza haematococci]